MRLFLSLNAPGPVREGLRQISDQVKARLRGEVKWGLPEQYHLTLRFFGNVSEENCKDLCGVLAGICTGQRAFELAYEKLGAFPNWRRARIIWAGFSDPTGSLSALEREIRAGSSAFGQPPEVRDFSPHITLARVKTLHRLVAEPTISVKVPVWMVREITLMKSELKPTGPVYSAVAAWPLALGSA